MLAPEAFRVLAGNNPKEEVHALIEQLIAFGKAHAVRRETGGRPSTLLLSGQGEARGYPSD
jgi:hypothetical protein